MKNLEITKVAEDYFNNNKDATVSGAIKHILMFNNKKIEKGENTADRVLDLLKEAYNYGRFEHGDEESEAPRNPTELLPYVFECVIEDFCYQLGVNATVLKGTSEEYKDLVEWLEEQKQIFLTHTPGKGR